jgi:hypothetical protein
MSDKEAEFRAKQTAIFIQKHKDADLIVTDPSTKEPIEARYFNKTSLGYQIEENKRIFHNIGLKQYFEEKKSGE